jgi:hypothetical protein
MELVIAWIHKNPADAVAELLIWVKEQNYERIKKYVN